MPAMADWFKSSRDAREEAIERYEKAVRSTKAATQRVLDALQDRRVPEDIVDSLVPKKKSNAKSD